MQIPIPGGLGKGGGGLAILLVIGIFVLQQCAGINIPVVPGGTSAVYSPSRLTDSTNGAESGDRYADCQTGEDANNSSDCARVAVENSLNDYWSKELGGKFHSESALVTFTGQTRTGCGAADSGVGPFYCPSDEAIYLDTSFFDEVFERQLGGPDGGFVEAYVLAHEFGHHIQNLQGFMDKVTSQATGPQSDGVRLELQADCYAGLWSKHATETKDASGEVLVQDLTEQDINLALQAAETVGDDYIQQKAQGQVDQDSWTHGSSEQRKRWFMTGYDQGTVEACDTFTGHPQV